MNITGRQEHILERIIREYIEKAQPISSQLIEKKCKLGICPATVRNEMQKLTDMGYVFQPHTSAGRIPTDKGYRFFVDRLLESEVSSILDMGEIEKELEERDAFRWALNLTRYLSRASSSLAVSYLEDKNLFLKEGWEDLLREPEFGNRRTFSDFALLLESFDKVVREMKGVSEIKVFIGGENPAKGAKDFGMVVARCRFPQKTEGVISLLGPKRMSYNRNIGLLNSLIKALEDF